MNANDPEHRRRPVDLMRGVAPNRLVVPQAPASGDWQVSIGHDPDDLTRGGGGQCDSSVLHDAAERTTVHAAEGETADPLSDADRAQESS